MKLEVIIIPVSDVDRAKEFYVNLGCARYRRSRMAASGHSDHAPQLGCSIIFAKASRPPSLVR
jgi:catechol 2,3-dioxygenase-like lactoylglutathione lyase family enzyme